MADQPIHILHFSPSVARGGVEEYILTLLRRLNRRLFRQSFACNPALAESMAHDIPADVETVPLVLHSPAHWSGIRALARAIRQKHVAIMHSHQFRASMLASPIAQFLRVPVVLETPHIREYWRLGRRGLKGSYVLDRLVARCVDRYIAVSSANARYLTEVKRIPAGKIETIRFGCDLSRFDSHQTEGDMKIRLGLAESDVVLVVAGRLEEQKGHAVLLDAMKLALAHVPNLRLLCVGDGSLRDDLERRACALGVDHAVRFYGFQNNIPEWLAMADISVLPSYFEGLPLTLIESSAAGRPVIATAVDGTPEVIVDGQTGILTEPGNALALSRAIEALATDQALRRRMGEAGRAWVRSHFTEERFVCEIEQLYLDAYRVAPRKHLAKAPEQAGTVRGTAQ